MKLLLSALALVLCAVVTGAERINQEGRILGPLNVPTTPLLFNTPEADAVVASMQIFPRDNPWNEDISRRPTLPNSAAMIAQVMADLSSSRRTLRPFFEMNFALVPDAQALRPIAFFNYPDESDPGPYPIPSILPVEGWPVETDGLSLSDWQEDMDDTGGDRHSIIVMPGQALLWETWLTKRVDESWEASNGAKFNLDSNGLRPEGWTSGDAAGLPMFPALVRYDECERGMVEHAMRLVVKRTRVGPIYPARHQASVGNLTSTNIPAMGQRFRLKAGYEIPSNWTKQEKAVLLGLKKYGAIVADNGNFFSISVTPDDRYPENAFSHLSSISITNFEVIQTTGPTEGPRSQGAPQVFAGSDQTVGEDIPVQLAGSVLYTNAAPLTILWKLYEGPGAVAFEDPAKTSTTARFSTPGTYILELKGEDGVHTPAYDAVTVTVTDAGSIPIEVRTTLTGETLVLSWTAAYNEYVIESAPTLNSVDWREIATISKSAFSVSIGPANQFFRVRGR
jgi:hypothetical protein